MTSDNAGTPNSPSAADTHATPLDTQADVDPESAEHEEHASPVEHAKDTARRVGAKMGTAVPRTSKGRWGAFAAAVAAAAGVAAGWVIRRGRRRKLPWLR